MGGRTGGITFPKKGADLYLPPPPNEDTVRIIPLGGVEEVGRNMTVVETNNDIFIVDVGFQFVPEDDAPGVDYILPNTRYLEENKHRITAIFITHAHLDHIGGVPFILNRIGNPPIYTRYITSLMLKKRQDEFPQLPPLNIHVMEEGERVKVGSTYVKSFPVTHSIPDSMGVSIETKHGNVLLTGDLKLNHVDGIPTEEEDTKWTALGRDNNLMFIADSTNAERDGFSITEAKVHQTIEEIIRTVKGRLIIGTFASQFERMIKILEIAEKLGKKVVTEGRSIKTNIEIAQKAGILKVNPNVMIGSQEIPDYPSDRIIILATGAQGEEFAALMRIATKKHKFVTLTERDTIVFSSSVIPGNEVAVQRLKDNLYRHGITLLHYRSSDVHSTGHGNTGELIWINNKVGARFFMPAYGYHSMLRCHAKAVLQAGVVPKENIIVPDNGTVIDIENGVTLKVHKDKVPGTPMMVDGFSIGDVQEVVIRDRQMLAQDGMFVIIATVNLKTGRLRKSPDIISRGFIYLRESQDLLSESRLLIKKTIEDTTVGMNPVDLEYVKGNLSDTVGRFLFQKTSKAPMVIPVLIGI
jgi:ribonuclease J